MSLRMVVIDDKYVPLSRVMWVSALPHYCGHEGCEREGRYEIRLEQNESLWTPNREERDSVLTALDHWEQHDSGPQTPPPQGS